MTLSLPTLSAMKVLDKDLFNMTKHISAIKVCSLHAAKTANALHIDLLNTPRLRNIVPDEQDQSMRLLLLNKQVNDISDLSTSSQSFLSSGQVHGEIVDYTLNVNYDHWSAEEVIRAVIPGNVEMITAFESVGEVAHMNLREHMLPIKSLIGQIILDKNPRIKTVVNKTSNIKTQFRTFPLEILASIEPTHTAQHLLTQVSENNVTLQFDFANVYWNSRLHTEHTRLIERFQSGELVADVMCGVGPFAIPAGKYRNVIVWANDLNPNSYKWLKTNIDINRVHLVRPFNEDARHFIRTSIIRLNQSSDWEDVQQRWQTEFIQRECKFKAKKRRSKNSNQDILDLDVLKQQITASWLNQPVQHFNHYIMNLPASALTFLDAFHGLYTTFTAHRTHLSKIENLPLIHVHCFSRSTIPEQDVVDRINQLLGTQLKVLASALPPISDKSTHKQPHQKSWTIELLPYGCVHVHRVRTVAPNKEMLCATFRLPAEVAFGETTLGELVEDNDDESHDRDLVETSNRADEPVAKKQKN